MKLWSFNRILRALVVCLSLGGMLAAQSGFQSALAASSQPPATPVERLKLVSNRFFTSGQAAALGGGAGNSNYTRGESRHLFWTPDADVVGARVIVCNWGTSNTGEFDGANNIVAAEALETTGTGAASYYFRWGSSGTSTTVTPGNCNTSDPLPFTLSRNTQYWQRSSRVVNSGETFIMTVSNWATGEGGFNSTSASTQLAATGAMTNPGGGASNGGGIMPAALIGYTMRNGKFVDLPAVWGNGDSIAFGLGPNTASDGLGNNGYVSRGVYQCTAGGATLAHFGGYKPSDQANANLIATGPKKRLIMRYATHALFENMSNDFANGQTLAQGQASAIELWTEARRNGLKVWNTTITPKTTSNLALLTLPTIAAGGTGYAASSTFNVTVAGGSVASGGSASVVSVTTNSSGVVTTVNSVVTAGLYNNTGIPSSTNSPTGGTGSGLSLTLTYSGFFDAANQFYATNFDPGGIADQYNQWLFAQVGQGLLDGVIDVAAQVRDPAFPMKWKSNGTGNYYTRDGTHFETVATVDVAVNRIAPWCRQISP